MCCVCLCLGILAEAAGWSRLSSSLPTTVFWNSLSLIWPDWLFNKLLKSACLRAPSLLLKHAWLLHGQCGSKPRSKHFTLSIIYIAFYTQSTTESLRPLLCMFRKTRNFDLTEKVSRGLPSPAAACLIELCPSPHLSMCTQPHDANPTLFHG